MNDDISKKLAPADGAEQNSAQNTEEAVQEQSQQTPSPVAGMRDPAAVATGGTTAAAASDTPVEQGASEADAMFGGKTSPAATAAEPSGTTARNPNDDISAQVSDHIQKSQQDVGAQEADKLFGGAGSDAAPSPASLAAGASPAGTGDVSGGTSSVPAGTIATSTVGMGKKILLDILHGTTQLPSEIGGGVMDAMHSAMGLAGELESFAAKHLPEGTPVGFNPITKKFLYGDDLKNIAEADQSAHLIPEPDSVTGKMVRGVSQFLAGFLATGAAGEAAGVAGKAGMAVEGLVKGAVTDYAFFEGKTQNLADLIEAHPKLANPITAMFATHPDDPELLNRAKNSAAGALLGVGAEGLMTGLTKAVQFLRQAGGSSAYGQIVAKWLGHEAEIPKTIQPFEVASLGDPAGELLTKKMAAADAATEGINPGEAIGQGPGYDINFAAINTSDDVKHAMSMMASREDQRIAAGKGGTESWEQTNAKANQIDAFKTISERRQGEPLNASQIVAARRLYVSSAQKLTDMATIASQSPTPANLFMFERMASIHSLVQKEVLNAGSELGRGLQALKIPVGGSEQMAGQISQMLEDMGGAAGSLDKANKVMKIAASQAGQAGVDSFVQGTAMKSVKDAIDQAYINGRFSQKTLVVKTVSDFANMGYQMLLRHNAEIISQKLGTEGGVVAGEAAAMANGWVSANRSFLGALADNLKKASSVQELLQAPRSSIKQVGGIPFELPPTGKIAASNFNIPDSTLLGKSLNVFNAGTQVFGRGISLVDQYSKMVGYQMELHAQALRKATAEMPDGGVSPAAFQSRIADIVASPPADIHLAAVDQASYQTFTAKPAEALQKLGSAVQSFPIFGRMLLPFKNTPINIMTQAMENSPMAPLLQSWRADMMAGGSRADLAMAKVATGTTLLQLSMDLAMKGVISGRGPQHPGERGNWERLGNQSYSLTLPSGEKVAYNRFEPQGYTLGIGADIAEAIKRADDTVDDKAFTKVLTGASFAIANNVLSKSYLMGISELIRALNAPEQEGEAYIKRLVGTIPSTLGTSAVSTVQAHTDPYARIADGMVEALYRRIPGLSKTLPLQRNLWGEPLSRSSDMGAAYDAFSPYWLKSPNPSPIDEELKRLKYFPDMPSHAIRDGGKTVDMNGHQFDRFMELAGNGLKDPSRGNLGLRDALNQMVEGKGAFGAIYKENAKLDAMDGGDRQKTLIQHTIRAYQDKARAKIVGEDGGLQASIDSVHAGDRIHSTPVKQRVFSTGSELKGD